MNLKTFLAVCLSLAFFALSAVYAQKPLDLEPNDSMQSVLQRHIGDTVEFRLASGEKIGGKLEKVNEKLAFLSQLTGAEYFSSVVVIDNVAAVVVRAKK